MKVERKILFSFFAIVIMASGIFPAYASVQTIHTDKTYYVGEDTIKFSGMVEEGVTDLITVVVHDSNNEFVLLRQTFPQADDSYELIIDTKSKFLTEGTYNATAFVINMTRGASMLFDYYFHNDSIHSELLPTTVSEDVVEIDQNHADSNSDEPLELENSGNVEESLESEDEVVIENNITTIPGFPDPEKDPQYYIDRYENEPKYKEWFDYYFPDKTIYEVVGVDENFVEEIESHPENDESVIQDDISLNVVENTFENIVDEQIVNESSFTTSNNSELSQIVFAIGGLGVLFGAVYGIKKRVDTNSVQIAKNRVIIQKKVNSNCNDPLDVLKNRLAQGEISIRQYKKLRKALDSVN